MGLMSTKNAKNEKKGNKKNEKNKLFHPFRKGWFDILGDKHITINPARKGKCKNPKADAYERTIQESSLLELIKGVKNPIQYWNVLATEQKKLYDSDFSVFKKKYRRSVMGGIVVVSIALVIVVGIFSWITFRYTVFKMGL